MTNVKKQQPKLKLQKQPETPPIAQKKKTSNWTIPTVLGLILGGVGALSIVELRPQLTVTPLSELSNNQAFSTPFEITNAGYFDLHVDHITAIFHRAEVVWLNGVRWNSRDDSESGKDWDNLDLSRGGGTKTILPYLANGVVVKADIVIAVDYRLFGIKGKRFKARFMGSHGDNWQWSKEPVGDLEPKIDAVIDAAITKHKEALANLHSPTAPN